MRQITIFFLFVFFSLSQITFAQPMALIEGFDSETTRHAQKINQLLNAYQLESSGDLKRAKKTWGLAPDSLTKSNHLFFIQFFLNKPIPPTSKTQVVFQGNYYLWRHQYAKANKLLESRAILSASEKILLIHAQLALGKYQKAAKALAQFSPANLEEKEKINLARLWYYQLTEQDKKAQEIWRLLMQDFLYQDWGNLVLSGVSPKAQEIEKAILLQLGSNRLFEKLFFAYKDQQKKIAFIEDYEGDLTGWVVHSPLIPMELRPPDLQIFNYLASEDSSPNDFERWANYWIKKKQGVNLKKLGEIYQERYPKLEDGSIYLKKGENLIALEAGAREGANTNVAQLK